MAHICRSTFITSRLVQTFCTMHAKMGLAILGLALAVAGVAAKPAPLSSSAIMFYDCEVSRPEAALNDRTGPHASS